jgi:hypothetical protein
LHGTVRETGKRGAIELITGNAATKKEVIIIGLNGNLTDGVVVFFFQYPGNISAPSHGYTKQFILIQKL